MDVYLCLGGAGNVPYKTFKTLSRKEEVLKVPVIVGLQEQLVGLR